MWRQKFGEQLTLDWRQRQNEQLHNSPLELNNVPMRWVRRLEGLTRIKKHIKFGLEK